MSNSNGRLWLSVFRPNEWGELTRILSCSLGAGEILVIGPHSPDKISERNQEVLRNPKYTITDPKTSIHLRPGDLERRFPKVFGQVEEQVEGGVRDTE